jgi:hypothetical protein
MAEAQGITCLQPLRSAPLERAPAPSPQSHRPQAAPTPSKETGGSKSSSVAGCFSAPTCAFLPPCSQIHSERHGFSSGSGPARGDGGIGQFQWPCACVGENQNASRERERGLPDLMRLFARFCRKKKRLVCSEGRRNLGREFLASGGGRGMVSPMPWTTVRIFRSGPRERCVSEAFVPCPVVPVIYTNIGRVRPSI